MQQWPASSFEIYWFSFQFRSKDANIRDIVTQTAREAAVQLLGLPLFHSCISNGIQMFSSSSLYK